MTGEDLAAAWEAIKMADRLRAEYEAKYMQPDAIPPGEADAFQRTLDAYEKALAICERSEKEPYVRFRLAGLYGCRRDTEHEFAELKEVARRFPATEYEMKAYLSIGLEYLDGLHDAVTALAYLERVRILGSKDDQGATARNRFRETDNYYRVAQMQMAACEFALGQPGAAEGRFRNLMEKYPKLASALRSDLNILRGQYGPAWRRQATRSLPGKQIEPDLLFQPFLTKETPLEPLVASPKGKSDVTVREEHTCAQQATRAGAIAADSASEQHRIATAFRHEGQEARGIVPGVAPLTTCIALFLTTGLCTLFLWKTHRSRRKS